MPQKQTPVHPPRTHILPTIFLVLNCRISTFHLNNPTTPPTNSRPLQSSPAGSS